MKLKIVSDGKKTTVVDADTGRVLDGVLMVDWSYSEEGGTTAMLALTGVPVELEAEARSVTVSPEIEVDEDDVVPMKLEDLMGLLRN